MTREQPDPTLDEAIAMANEMPETTPEEVDDIMAGIREHPSRPERVRRARRRSLMGATAAAALIAVVATLGSHEEPEAPSLVRFDIRVPEATSVALVGDFNDWDRSATTLRMDDGGLWMTELGLGPGRYTYAFLIDGERWITDDSEALAPATEYGPPNSVILVPPIQGSSP